MITQDERSTSEGQRLTVVRRCGNRCEAQVHVNGVWARCWDSPVEVHHALTRARGGNLLDEIGETYHLFGLCPFHHRAAHSAGGRKDLLIDGYVIQDSATGNVVYKGPDEYLTKRYGGN